MKNFIKLAIASTAVLFAAVGLAQAADQPKETRLDSANYSPHSLVLKKFCWF